MKCKFCQTNAASQQTILLLTWNSILIKSQREGLLKKNFFLFSSSLKYNQRLKYCFGPHIKYQEGWR